MASDQDGPINDLVEACEGEGEGAGAADEDYQGRRSRQSPESTRLKSHISPSFLLDTFSYPFRPLAVAKRKGAGKGQPIGGEAPTAVCQVRCRPFRRLCGDHIVVHSVSARLLDKLSHSSQVSGCDVSLHNKNPSAAYLRYKLCHAHLRAESVTVCGKEFRFCQK